MAKQDSGLPVVKSAGRVFEVLELFRQSKRSLSIREVADRCRYPASSTAVLMKSMATLGYIHYDRKLRTYYPTLKLADLGEWVYGAMAARNGLVQLLEELSIATGKIAILAAQSGIYAHYLNVVQTNNRLRTLVPPGSRRLLCRSATGWAMLAQLSDDSIRTIVQSTRMQLGTMARDISYDWLMVNLRETRRRGYAVSRGMVVNDVVVVAMPLPLSMTGSQLAVGLSGTTRRMDKDMELVVSELTRTIKSGSVKGSLPIQQRSARSKQGPPSC